MALLVFNRPAHTARSLEPIRRQEPSRLFVIADGPRPHEPGDEEAVRAVRDLVDGIDWDCEITRIYADTNLGLKRRITSGLDQVFDAVDRAIVLEDDCVASDDFFGFCESLLGRYAGDERVAAITGDNFQARDRHEASYYFSKYPHVWGWATWRRAWRLNDPGMDFLDELVAAEAWRSLHPDAVERRYWERILYSVRRGEIDSWAYPWTASVWNARGLTATPTANLVANIGFGSDATNTTTRTSGLRASRGSLGPIVHPDAVEQDRDADRRTFRRHFSSSPVNRLLRRLRGLGVSERSVDTSGGPAG